MKWLWMQLQSNISLGFQILNFFWTKKFFKTIGSVHSDFINSISKLFTCQRDYRWIIMWQKCGVMGCNGFILTKSYRPPRFFYPLFLYRLAPFQISRDNFYHCNITSRYIQVGIGINGQKRQDTHRGTTDLSNNLLMHVMYSEMVYCPRFADSSTNWPIPWNQQEESVTSKLPPLAI